MPEEISRGARPRCPRPARRRAPWGTVLLASWLTLAAAPARSEGGACAPEPWQPAPAQPPTGGDAAAPQPFPESASALRRLIAAAHEAGDGPRVRAGMLRLADMGYALSPRSQSQLAPHLSAEDADLLRRRFDENRNMLAASRLAATVPAERRLIEGIARDRRTGRLFATSVVGRELLVQDGAGWRAVPGVEAGSLFGMAVDAGRRRLWVASGSLEQTPAPETAFRGLIAIDLDRLEVAGRIAADGAGSPGDVTIGPDGTLYASDPVSGALYRARPGERSLSILVPPGRLRSPQGLALSPDGTRLYVADYANGIGVVDLAAGRIARLGARIPAMLDGVDGLLAVPGGLIVIQNGTSPRRIARLRLGAACDEVVAIEVLERANPEWGEPTLGIVDGEELLYVADAQWERYGRGGALVGDGPTRPTAIRALPLPARAP